MQPLTGPYVYGVKRRSENSDGYFHRACAICEKSWWKVPEKSG